jgi:hypothetical protein
MIVERTHRQILTFAWPEGADAVYTYVGVSGQSAQTAIHGQPEELTREQYERQGGLHFRHKLPTWGCSVHAVPVSFSAGRRITGPSISLEYPGLLRLRYTIGVTRDRNQRPVSATVQIFSEADTTANHPFVLVHRPDRLPLHMYDGNPVPVQAAVQGGRPEIQFTPPALLSSPGPMAWNANIDNMSGFLRLFVYLDPTRPAPVALIDPAVSELRLPPAAPPQRAAR